MGPVPSKATRAQHQTPLDHFPFLFSPSPASCPPNRSLISHSTGLVSFTMSLLNFWEATPLLRRHRALESTVRQTHTSNKAVVKRWALNVNASIERMHHLLIGASRELRQIETHHVASLEAVVAARLETLLHSLQPFSAFTEEAQLFTGKLVSREGCAASRNGDAGC